MPIDQHRTTQETLEPAEDTRPLDIWDAELVIGLEDGENSGLPETELKLLTARQALAKLRGIRSDISEFVDTSTTERADFQNFSTDIMKAVERIIRLNSNMEQLIAQMGPAINGSLASIPNMDDQITEKDRVLTHLEQFYRDLSILEAALRAKEQEILITQQLIDSRESGEGSNLPDISQLGKIASGINDDHITSAIEILPRQVKERELIALMIDKKVDQILSTAQIIETEASAYVDDLTTSHDIRIEIINKTKANAQDALKELGASVVKNSAVRGALIADPEARWELLSLPDVREALMADEGAINALLADERVVKALLANPVAADALMARLLDQPLEITER